MANRVLIVDDSSTIRSMQSIVLRAAGFMTDGASNGIEALEKLYSGTYELVLVDINMPKMDGLRMVKALREQKEYATLPVIIISSESDARDRQQSMDAGATLHLVKPTNPAQLVESVRKLIEGAGNK